MTIQIIITGGTIDSYYEGIKDTVVPNEKSVLPRYFQSMKLYEDVSFSEICMKDSRDLSKENVNLIANTIDKSNNKKFIVTHGTYTMPDTARYLQANLERKDVTVILTGSMIPLVGFSPSDAGFNLGYAIAKLDELKLGIYVAMNGKIFTPDEVAKYLKDGRFVSIFSKND